jgi:hypothetical protein
MDAPGIASESMNFINDTGCDSLVVALLLSIWEVVSLNPNCGGHVKSIMTLK